MTDHIEQGALMSENAEQSQEFIQKIIWGALTASQAIYLGLALFVASPTPEQIASMEQSSTAMIFFGIGLMEIGLAVFLMPKILNVPENPKSSNELMVPRIIQWAIIESAMILGLVASFQGGPQVVPIGLYVVALIAMVKTFPSDIKVASDSE